MEGFEARIIEKEKKLLSNWVFKRAEEEQYVKGSRNEWERALQQLHTEEILLKPPGRPGRPGDRFGKQTSRTPDIAMMRQVMAKQIRTNGKCNVLKRVFSSVVKVADFETQSRGSNPRS